ncbi:hypothetical protein Q9233_016129 [Columba guinea]|nr:hypothetical protein Q9233_016129 [Columba guinea]
MLLLASRCYSSIHGLSAPQGRGLYERAHEVVLLNQVLCCNKKKFQQKSEVEKQFPGVSTSALDQALGEAKKWKNSRRLSGKRCPPVNEEMAPTFLRWNEIEDWEYFFWHKRNNIKEELRQLHPLTPLLLNTAQKHPNRCDQKPPEFWAKQENNYPVSLLTNASL